MSEKKQYLFGPVPSRRLGLSLGVDIVPFKYCSLDCLYCQLGPTTCKTVERKAYVDIQEVLEELRDRISHGLKADYITFSGSGEPTLNSEIASLITGIKKLTDIPVAVLTNATLFPDADVRKACSLADLVVPSLDAPDQATFELINQPQSGIKIDEIIESLIQFRSEFTGKIWLEIFLIEPINTTQGHIEKFKKIIERIDPDRIQLNTAVRPTAYQGVKKLSPEKIHEIAEKLGPKTEVVATFSPSERGQDVKITSQTVLSMLKRRPCSLEDICSGLGIHKNEALKYVGHFQDEGIISTEKRDGVIYYKAN